MIVALCTVLALIAAHEQGSQGSTLTSPCPHVFLYDPPRSNPGFWSGVVALTTNILLQSTKLNIELDGHATRLVNGLGNVTTQDGFDFTINNDEMQIYPGQPVLVPFFIQYDPLNTIPRLRAIRLNEKIICNAVTQQTGTVGRPVVLALEVRTNVDMKQVPTPPSKPNNPVYQRPINNAPAPAFNPEHRTYLNNSATSEMVECGVMSGGNERVTLSFEGLNNTRGDIPWHAAIYLKREYYVEYICGGTLVSDRHVVTAAACILPVLGGPQIDIKKIVVRLGIQYVNDWGDNVTVTRKVEAIFVHQDFNDTTFQNDILIFSLNKRVKFDEYIGPVCLWSGDTALSRVVGATGVVNTVAGGGIKFGEDVREHYLVLVPIVSTSYCRASNARFRKLTSDTTLCAGARNGVGPCFRDGGAGLYLLEGGRWRLRGIVSVTLASHMTDINGKDNDCDLNEFVVYTDTAQYLTWIRNILAVK